MDIKKEVGEAIKKALEELGFSKFKIDFSLEQPENLAYGDYATNVAMVAFKRFRPKTDRSLDEKVKNPLDLARKIIEKLNKQLSAFSIIAKVEAVPPGFINFYLSQDYLFTTILRSIVVKEKFGGSQMGKGKTVVIDYSSPNIAKPFGIGHLRSTIIGQALCNIYSFLGYRVIGDNHLGDWGTQFGALLCQIKLKIKSEKLKVEDLTINDLERLYVEFHQEVEKNPDLEVEARKWFKRLEDGDEEAERIWQIMVDISMKEFKRIYGLLGVSFDVVLGESFYVDKMAGVIADAQDKGIIKESRGAKVINIPGVETPAMLVKSDGATTYFLRDLAAIKYREKKWRPLLMIYEVGADQIFHFHQLFAVARMLGYLSEGKLIHVAHGMVRGLGGKLSTRLGKTIHLEAVLAEAIGRAEELAKKAGVSKNLSLRERKKVAKIVGIGAVKYSDLKQNPKTDVIFDWDKILTLEGNAGPYLQYTYARCKSVLSKKENLFLSTRDDVMKIILPKYQPNFDELAIARIICHFEEVVKEAAKSFSPNLIANFLYDLSQKYNNFYNQHRILGEGGKKEQLRLLLTLAVAQTLKNGLNLLGIDVLEKM